MKTQSFKKSDIKESWILVDAEHKTLGRLASSLASSLTTANTPDPDCISSSEKGTLDANFAISSKAFAPSCVLPNNCFN